MFNFSFVKETFVYIYIYIYVQRGLNHFNNRLNERQGERIRKENRKGKRKDIFRQQWRSKSSRANLKDRFFTGDISQKVSSLVATMYRDFRRGTKCPGVVITRSLCNYSPGVIENDPLTGDKTLIPPLLPDDCSVSVNFNLPDLNSSVALHDVSADPSSYEFRFIELRSERIGIRERIRIRKRI